MVVVCKNKLSDIKPKPFGKSFAVSCWSALQASEIVNRNNHLDLKVTFVKFEEDVPEKIP